MLTGRRYKLTIPTLGLIEKDGKRRAVTIPAGAIVKVASGPTSDKDRMVDVVWDGRIYAVFVVDVRDRGEEIADTSV